MGTATFDISEYGINGKGNLPGKLLSSGAHTTSTTASNLTDGAAGAGSAVNGPPGAVIRVKLDEDGRIAFGGDTATAVIGHALYAGDFRDIEIPEGGTISIIDVA